MDMSSSSCLFIDPRYSSTFLGDTLSNIRSEILVIETADSSPDASDKTPQMISVNSSMYTPQSKPFSCCGHRTCLTSPWNSLQKKNNNFQFKLSVRTSNCKVSIRHMLVPVEH
jgi:hypothetical protein